MTPDEAALWQAVLATPADDFPRLVYADYLEDHGRGPLARFIRAQIQLAATPPSHPNHAAATLAQALAVAEVRAASSLPVPDLPPGARFTGDVCDLEQDGFGSYFRGLAQSVQLSGLHVSTEPTPFVEMVQGLFARNATRSLHLRHVPTAAYEALLAAPCAAEIDELHVELRMGNLAAITETLSAAPLPALRRFTLTVNSEPGPAAWRELASLSLPTWVPRLTHVTLPGDALATFAPWLGSNLQSLTLDQLQRRNMPHLALLAPRLNALHTLGLDLMNPADTTVNRLAQMDFASISALHVSASVWNAQSLGRLLAAPWLDSVRKLVLRGSMAPIMGACQMARPTWPRLHRLVLNSVGHSVENLLSLIQTERFPILSTFIARGFSGRGTFGFGTFAEAWRGEHLHTLILDECPAPVPTLRVLAANPAFASLRRLSLARSQVTGVGAALLLTSPHLTRLAEVNFVQNTISERVGKLLLDPATWPELLLANLTTNHLPADLRTQLRATRPVWA